MLIVLSSLAWAAEAPIGYSRDHASAFLYPRNSPSPPPSLLVRRIVRCESGWNPKAFNPLSGATGLGQFIPSTQRRIEEKWGMDLDFWDYDDNLYAVRRLVREDGASAWNASKSCWGRR